jgi:hypothetical protein
MTTPVFSANTAVADPAAAATATPAHGTTGARYHRCGPDGTGEPAGQHHDRAVRARPPTRPTPIRSSSEMTDSTRSLCPQPYGHRPRPERTDAYAHRGPWPVGTAGRLPSGASTRLSRHRLERHAMTAVLVLPAPHPETETDRRRRASQRPRSPS